MEGGGWADLHSRSKRKRINFLSAFVCPYGGPFPQAVLCQCSFPFCSVSLFCM